MNNRKQNMIPIIFMITLNFLFFPDYKNACSL